MTNPLFLFICFVFVFLFSYDSIVEEWESTYLGPSIRSNQGKEAPKGMFIEFSRTRGHQLGHDRKVPEYIKQRESTFMLQEQMTFVISFSLFSPFIYLILFIQCICTSLFRWVFSHSCLTFYWSNWLHDFIDYLASSK